MQSEKGDKIEAAWTMNTPDDLEVEPALEDTPPGKITIAISQFGLSSPDNLNLQAYSEAGHLSGLTLYAGDPQAVLRGTRLDQVASLDLNGLRFNPGTLRAPTIRTSCKSPQRRQQRSPTSSQIRSSSPRSL